MTLGEKLAKLRKENNYTQEQLADILGVSRQSVSKWELDVAYPETDKLVKLGELYDCSMDYLLKDSLDETETGSTTQRFDIKSLYFERKSTRTINGLPLWHINIGLGRTAKGVLAIGLCAKGIVSLGVFSLGVISLGVFAIGLLALGALALGFVAAGAFSVGIIAFGAICVGLLAVGAIAIGQFSVGALSIGNYLAIGDNSTACIAIGKTQANGTLFQATAITAANRAEIVSLLDQIVPPALNWINELIKSLI
ncbi:MAG: helix-turn-helix domain-containing protein [Christensenellales bacterium]